MQFLCQKIKKFELFLKNLKYAYLLKSFFLAPVNCQIYGASAVRELQVAPAGHSWCYLFLFCCDQIFHKN